MYVSTICEIYSLGMWRSSTDGFDEQIFGADKQGRSRDQSD
jgi:hypothetical protein